MWLQKINFCQTLIHSLIPILQNTAQFIRISFIIGNQLTTPSFSELHCRFLLSDIGRTVTILFCNYLGEKKTFFFNFICWNIRGINIGNIHHTGWLRCAQTHYAHPVYEQSGNTSTKEGLASGKGPEPMGNGWQILCVLSFLWRKGRNNFMYMCQIKCFLKVISYRFQ